MQPVRQVTGSLQLRLRRQNLSPPGQALPCLRLDGIATPILCIWDPECSSISGPAQRRAFTTPVCPCCCAAASAVIRLPPSCNDPVAVGSARALSSSWAAAECPCFAASQRGGSASVPLIFGEAPASSLLVKAESMLVYRHRLAPHAPKCCEYHLSLRRYPVCAGPPS